jgi:SnoaL-like domain
VAAERPGAFVERFLAAMATSDMAAIAASVDPQVRAFITNATGGTDHVEGRGPFLQRFPDFASMADSFEAVATQVHEIDGRSVLAMVEIHAERKGATLHNFAGVLIRLSDEGRMTEYRMVEALPEESDRFWSA